jgi:hypothetical protein
MKPTFAHPFSLPLAPADRRRLLDIARGLLGTQADAEDVLHDAYLRAVGDDTASSGFVRTLGGDRTEVDRLRATLTADLDAITTGLSLLDAS